MPRPQFSIRPLLWSWRRSWERSVRLEGMDQNPYKAPDSPQNQHNGYTALDIAWFLFELLALAVMGAPVLFLPEEIKTPAQREMLKLANIYWAGGCTLLAVLVVPLAIWTWWRWKRG